MCHRLDVSYHTIITHGHIYVNIPSGGTSSSSSLSPFSSMHQRSTLHTNTPAKTSNDAKSTSVVECWGKSQVAGKGPKRGELPRPSFDTAHPESAEPLVTTSNNCPQSVSVRRALRKASIVVCSSRGAGERRGLVRYDPGGRLPRLGCQTVPQGPG